MDKVLVVLVCVLGLMVLIMTITIRRLVIEKQKQIESNAYYSVLLDEAMSECCKIVARNNVNLEDVRAIGEIHGRIGFVRWRLRS